MSQLFNAQDYLSHAQFYVPFMATLQSILSLVCAMGQMRRYSIVSITESTLFALIVYSCSTKTTFIAMKFVQNSTEISQFLQALMKDICTLNFNFKL